MALNHPPAAEPTMTGPPTSMSSDTPGSVSAVAPGSRSTESNSRTDEGTDAVTPPEPTGLQLLMAMVVAVGMNLVAALLVDAAASTRERISVVGVVLLGSAVAVNGVRFVLWHAIHRRFHLADVLPLTALFFPLVALSSWLKGEAMNLQAVIGVGLITAGAWTIARKAGRVRN